jgi:hypothetical protein
VASAASIGRNLGARRQGRNWHCDCLLGCGYPLSLADGEDGRLLAHCYGGCSFDEIRAALVEHGLLDDDDVAYEPVPPIRLTRTDEADRITRAKDFYASLVPDPAISTYLLSRSIRISSPVLRWAPYYRHRCGYILPAMVAPIVDVTGKLTAIHATFLRPGGGGKANLPRELQRETRGHIGTGAVRLAPHDPGSELVIAEGIESTLSGMQLLGGLPGWSAVSAGGLKTIELPPAIDRIAIAVDHDLSGTGQRNAAAAMRRWRAEGRSVRALLPRVAGVDFNDLAERQRG